MAPVQLVDGYGEGKVGKAMQEGLEGDLSLHAGQSRAETVMDAVSECQMMRLGPLDFQ